jgi:hypothetical protein
MSQFLNLIFICAMSLIATSCAKENFIPAIDQEEKDKRKSDDATKENQAITEQEASEGDHYERPTDFSVADLLHTAEKATSRFERLAIPDSELLGVKTWKSETYAWARLVYKKSGRLNEEYLFLACHFHGEELGCHKKDESDPSEPADIPSTPELPPIEPINASLK